MYYQLLIISLIHSRNFSRLYLLQEMQRRRVHKSITVVRLVRLYREVRREHSILTRYDGLSARVRVTRIATSRESPFRSLCLLLRRIAIVIDAAICVRALSLGRLSINIFTCRAI